MTSTDIEMSSLEPLSNQESPATVDSTIKSNSATNLLDPQATVDVTDDSPATSSRTILSPIKGAVLFAIFTCIVMLIGILIVYFNSPKLPDNWDSFDAYGVKLATNDAVVVQARNKDAQFVLQFAPFNPSNLSSPCQIDYPGLATGDMNFIYSIDVPKVVSYDASVVFIGENSDNSSSAYLFIGHLLANASCETTYNMYYFTPFTHDEFFVHSIDPSGQIAYGFSSQFAFSYDLQTHSINYLAQWPFANF
ncbi:unnamed protein product, partial [Adineta steineri]